jgi:hypothetical protein
MSASKAAAIKNRAAGAHRGVKSRRAATTAKARRKELEKRPQALDTLRQRKPRPKVEPLKRADIRKERPGWTKNPPSADGTYIFGLGSAAYADEKVMDDAWAQARDRAYNEVASQLKVQIKGKAKITKPSLLKAARRLRSAASPKRSPATLTPALKASSCMIATKTRSWSLSWLASTRQSLTP